MFENVILATDLSPAWDEIVACAGELKALGCSRVILTHVITLKFLMGMEGRLLAEAWPKLERQGAQLEAQGLQVTLEMPSGLPAHSLQGGGALLRCGPEGGELPWPAGGGVGVGEQCHSASRHRSHPALSYGPGGRQTKGHLSPALHQTFAAHPVSRRIFRISLSGPWGM